MGRSNNLETTNNLPEQEPKRAGGCLEQGIFFIILIGIVLLLALAQSTSWSMDELIIDETLRTSWFSRVLPAAGFLVSLFIPLTIIAAFWKAAFPRAALRTWALAALFGIFLLPARILKIYQMQGADLLQLLMMVLFCSILLLWERRHTPIENPFQRPGLQDEVILVLAASGLLGLPWLAWGALGSPLDTLITLVNALGFGAATGLTLWYSLIKPIRDIYNRQDYPYIVASLTAIIALAIFAYGIEHTGLEWYLLYSIPLLGFAVTALGFYGKAGWIPLGILTGLASSFPLMLIDPDEVSLVINSGAGELISWVTRAGDVSLLITLIVGLVIYLLRNRLSARRTPSLRMVMVAIPWIIAIFVFAFFGKPGFYGEHIFVLLKDQPDVSSAAQIKDYNQRRQYVYQTLVQNATKSQAGLRKTLDSLRIGYTPYYLVNGLEVRGGPVLRAWLETQPEVNRVLDNPILRPLPEQPPQARGDAAVPTGIQWNQSLIGADRVWNDLHVNGKGVVVGQSDSGVQGTHPDLQDSYRGNGTSNDYNWLDPWNHSKSPVDIGGHGTHTLGIILGKKTGIAPGATWIGCVNLARNLGNPSVYLNCMQFMLAPYPQNGDPFKDGDPTRSAMVLNNSWGCPDIEGCDAGVFAPAVNALSAAGIFVVVSAGNSGEAGCGSVQDPLAIYASSYSVGAIDSSGNLASFSSLGPVTVDGSDRIKPDIVAPGVRVLSTFPGSTYQVLDGTSMAGPHVVGTVALMWSANPALIGDIQKTRDLLDQSAKPYQSQIPACVKSSTRPNDAVGWGVVDAYQAVKLAQQAK